MSKERIHIFFFILVLVNDSSCMINSLYDTGEEIWKLYWMIERIEFNTTEVFKELFISKNGSNEEIKNQLTDIFKRLYEAKESMDFVEIRGLFERFGESIFIVHDLDMVNLVDESISRFYEEFQRYIIRDTPYSHEKFQSFTQQMTLDGEGSIELLRKTLTGNKESLGGRKNLVSLIGDYSTSQRAKICNGPGLISSILVKLFKMVMLSELKSNIVMFFANIYEYVGETDIWKRMNSLIRSKFEQQFGIYLNLFTTNLIKSDSSYLRACDPDNGTWTQNDSFYELEGIIQTTMLSYNRPACNSLSCNIIQSGGVQHCPGNYYNDRSMCHNMIDDCSHLGGVQACLLKSGTHKFKYVDSTLFGLLGRDSACPEDNGHIIRDKPLWGQAHWVCACSCYGNDNKISLAIIESNVTKNMIITGVRFLREDKILYIQPKEGKLDANGRIIRYSERWIRIPQNIEASDVHSVDRMNRVFFFDDLRLPFGFVLTGIKFSKVTRSNVTGFAIGIYGSQFDYEMGIINHDERFRIFQQALDADAGKPLSFNAINPIHTKSINIPTPKDMKYVSLERSTLQSDFGQSTLPLFDAVPIETDCSFPLAGIGIFHKSVEGYAGFISLKVFGINYADHFKLFKSNHVKNGIVKFPYL